MEFQTLNTNSAKCLYHKMRLSTNDLKKLTPKMNSKDKTTDTSNNSPVRKFWSTLSEFCQDWTLELSFSYIISFEMPSSLLQWGAVSLLLQQVVVISTLCISRSLQLVSTDNERLVSTFHSKKLANSKEETIFIQNSMCKIFKK